MIHGQQQQRRHQPTLAGYERELDLKKRIVSDLPRLSALGSSSSARDIALVYASAWVMEPFQQ
jgi:hypothetical protein